MLTRKRILRLAEKYGPFVRFYPEGSEGSDEAPGTELSDEEAAAAAVAEAEPKVEDSPEFKGVFRDLKAERATTSHLNAENVAFKQQNEELQRQLAAAQKPKDEMLQLSEEEAAQEVTRGELTKTLRSTLAAHSKKLVSDVTELLNTRETKTKQTNLKKNQAADAQALKRTHTAETKGLTLDAKTVVEETIEYLSVNNPALLEALAQQPDYASLVYKIGTGEPLVPSVGQRVKLRQNTILAKKLDQKGDDTPGGGGAPASDDLSVFETIMSSGVEMSDEALDKHFET